MIDLWLMNARKVDKMLVIDLLGLEAGDLWIGEVIKTDKLVR